MKAFIGFMLHKPVVGMLEDSADSLKSSPEVDTNHQSTKQKPEIPRKDTNFKAFLGVISHIPVLGDSADSLQSFLEVDITLTEPPATPMVSYKAPMTNKFQNIPTYLKWDSEKLQKNSLTATRDSESSNRANQEQSQMLLHPYT